MLKVTLVFEVEATKQFKATGFGPAYVEDGL